MDPLLLLLVLLWSTGRTEFARLVRGASRCAGTLEIKHLGEWRPIDKSDWTLKTSAIFYSVRLLNGSSLCSGRLEVKSNQSWSSVCEADFDQQGAEVVCRELGCGPPSVLQGALYGEVEAPVWSKELQCGGHESALLDCRSSGSARNSCSPGKAVGLTCSEPFRLVGGANHCEGTVEVKQGGWRSVGSSDWSLKEAAAVCQHLDCGSAVSVDQRKVVSLRSMWRITPDCVHSGSAVRECARLNLFFYIQHLTCQGNGVRKTRCVSAFLQNVSESDFFHTNKCYINTKHELSIYCSAGFSFTSITYQSIYLFHNLSEIYSL
uniref:SRCR domain-containing protein n=1 Tax=Neolamprologus brichardi TaxID=32507 RepID=A0A3Q4MDW4_NEOBR